jgi:hypothetical protein
MISCKSILRPKTSRNRLVLIETLSYFHQRILEKNQDEDDKTAILVILNY